MKLRSDYRAAVLMKNHLHHEAGEPIEEPIHPGQQRRTCPRLELFNILDGNINLHLQVPRGGTNPNGVGCELTFFLLESLFCSSWFRLQLIAIHCNRRGVNRTSSHSAFFSRTLVQCPRVHMHSMAQGNSGRVSCKTLSSTSHHMSDRALSLLPLISSSLSSVFASCPISSPPLFCSSSMWSEPPSTRTPVHTQNEEYCPVAIQKISHNAEQGELSSDKMDTLRRSKTP